MKVLPQRYQCELNFLDGNGEDDSHGAVMVSQTIFCCTTCNLDNDVDMATLFIWRTTSIFFQDYVNYATMMADHESGNSIAETRGTSQIQIQGEIVSKYDNISA